MRRVVLVLLIIFSAASVEAQVYRWVDKDGKVHYSDKKPKDAASEELAIQSQASDPEAAEKAMAELKAQNQGLDEADAQRKHDAAKQAQAKQQREAQCKAAQSEVQLLTSVNRYYTIDHKGDRVYDDDAKLEARRSAARARAAQLCD